MRDSIKWVANRMPKSDDRQLSIMSLGNVAKARFFHSSFPQYSITPLARLDGMAKYLGLGGLFVKDESFRFGLNAFKVLGGSFAMARYIAKNLVAAGLCEKCQVTLAYAIGKAVPVMVEVDTFGTGTVADETIEKAVEKVFDLTPAAIIRDLDLRKPIYRQLAAYGHMGREDLGVKWENTDRVDALKAAVAAL